MIDTETAPPPPVDRSAEARNVTELLKARTESYAAERASDREAAREASTVADRYGHRPALLEARLLPGGAGSRPDRDRGGEGDRGRERCGPP